MVQRLEYALEDMGFKPNSVKRFFSSTKCPDQLWGPTSLLHNRYWGPDKGVKWLRHGVHHSAQLATRL
jgi:hypothetical protein